MTIEILKSEALKLKRVEMLEFVSFLIEAIRQQERTTVAASDKHAPPGISSEWEKEVKRRWKEVEEGTAKLSTLEELQAEINQIFGIESTTPQPR